MLAADAEEVIMGKIMTIDTFTYEGAKVGDLVDADVVMAAMNIVPPATMRTSCAQIGEAYSHRQDPDTGKIRPVFTTFRCVEGNWDNGVWEYRGHCFRGETVERGQDPYYMS